MPEPGRGWQIAAPLAVLALALAAWQVAVSAYELPVWLVPSTATVDRTLVADRELLAAALGVTLRIALWALALAVLLGVAAALLFVQSRWLEASLLPYAVLLQVTPVVAIAPLVIIWVKDLELALVLCATVVAIFPIIANTTLGLRSVDPGLLPVVAKYVRYMKIIGNRINGKNLPLGIYYPELRPLVKFKFNNFKPVYYEIKKTKTFRSL